MDISKALVAAMTAVSAASASTGGIHSNSNTVVTGASSASVHVVNTIHANDAGGTSVTHITTNDNGDVRDITTEHELAPGGSIDDDIATTTGHTRVQVSTHINSGTSSHDSTTPPAPAYMKHVPFKLHTSHSKTGTSSPHMLFLGMEDDSSTTASIRESLFDRFFGFVFGWW